jgi:hypothetical protein
MGMVEIWVFNGFLVGIHGNIIGFSGDVCGF